MRRVSILVTLAVLLLVMLPAHLTVAQKTGAVDNFTIYISSAGENGTAGNLTLGPINQGDTVIITFVWNDVNNAFNNHQMGIEGYNVTTDVLSQQTPTSVVQFTADKAGSFRILCIIPCLGMDNMQNGWLIVKPATTSTTSGSSNTSTASSSGTTSTVTTTSTSSSHSITGTKLSMLSMTVNDSELLASVGLSDSNGTPIAGAKVQFSILTDFGKLSVGSSTTMANGTAYLAYQLPSNWGGLLYASYSGSKSYAASNVTGAIQYSSPASGGRSPYVSGEGNFVDLRVVGVPVISAEVVMGIFLLVNFTFLGVMVFASIKVFGIRKRSETRVDK